MKKNIGPISLACAAAGLVLIQAGISMRLLHDWAWHILLAGFTAATVGGIADWFAIRALFHHIPIPLISRHTNILANNRKRLTEAMVDLITTKWLSPKILEEKINTFSASKAVLDLLANPGAQELLKQWPKNILKELDLSKPLGAWLQRMIAEEKHHEILLVIYELLLAVIRHPNTKTQLSKLVEQRAAEYGQENWLKRLLVSFADQGSIVDKLLRIVVDFIVAARNERDHVANREIERQLIRLANRLCYGPPIEFAMADKLKTLLSGLLTGLDLVELIKKNQAFADAADVYARKAAIWIQDKYYHRFGDMIRENLRQLSDAALVAQLQEKVGNDFQYIRLNGAVVGGLAGMLIYILQSL